MPICYRAQSRAHLHTHSQATDMLPTKPQGSKNSIFKKKKKEVAEAIFWGKIYFLRANHLIMFITFGCVQFRQCRSPTFLKIAKSMEITLFGLFN